MNRLKITRALRDSWQCRCLAESQDRLWRVVLAVLAHNFADALLVLLKVTYPQFAGLKRPLILGGATIARNGTVMCEVAPDRTGESPFWHETQVIYDSQDELVADFRRLADRLKLSDADRMGMITAVQRWVVADLRIDHEGRKLAS